MRQWLLCASIVAVAGCGGGGGPGNGNPAPLARAQSITFDPAPTLSVNGKATVHATASSGLPVRYGSSTPAICQVDARSGEVAALAAGHCVLTADQAGDSAWAIAAQATLALTVAAHPAQTIVFGPAPHLPLPGTATVQATASSGLPVQYSSLTPAVCRVDASSGLVTALAAGACTIAADQPGNTQYPAAVQARLDLQIAAAGTAPTAPGVPQGVSVRAGSTLGSVTLHAGQTDAGGSPVTGYTVTSSPAGISVSSATLPVQVQCPGGSCAGYAFSLSASNAVGSSAPSAPVDLLVAYDVHQVYREPDYMHIHTEFRGSFTFNASKKTVSALQGDLSEVMAGNDAPNQAWPMGMPLLHLKNQLFSKPASNGLLVGVFLLSHAKTLSSDARDSGADGWSPGTGDWKYYGYAHGDRTSTNPGNAYTLVYVNTTDPATPLTPAQIDLLAYADCAEQGMMGDDCMTGTTVAGYGVIGSMRGYPQSQTITRRSTP